jgi:hypothetical protein
VSYKYFPALWNKNKPRHASGNVIVLQQFKDDTDSVAAWLASTEKLRSYQSSLSDTNQAQSVERGKEQCSADNGNKHKYQAYSRNRRLRPRVPVNFNIEKQNTVLRRLDPPAEVASSAYYPWTIYRPNEDDATWESQYSNTL